MKRRRQVVKPIILFSVFIALSIFFSLISVKIWGEKLLEEDSFRQELSFGGEMTLWEFGKVNRLPNPLLKKVFGLAPKDDLQEKLKDFGLTHKEILNRVNDELLLQFKNKNPLVKWFTWTIKKLLNNFGLVTQDIQRSGQPKTIGLWLHYWLFPFRSVINLAWKPGYHPDQEYEIKFCRDRNIDYHRFSWNPAGPADSGEVRRVMEIIDSCRRPVWIHCRGGKDRTGGLVAIWEKSKGYRMELIFRDFEKYGIPAFTWIQKLFWEDIEHLPSSQEHIHQGEVFGDGEGGG
jgi:hypothetical protein